MVYNNRLGDEEINFKLDTGSEANLIPVSIFQKLPEQQLQPSTCRLVTYTGQRVQPIGETMIKINGQDIKFHITENGSPLLGKDTCVRLNMIARIGSVDKSGCNKQKANKMVNIYKDVFEGLGKIKVGAKIYVDETVEPVIDPPRRIPHSIIDDVKRELDRMLKLGVITEQAEPTPWVNSITIVRKPGKIRVCLDPTKLNKAILRGPYPTRTIEEVAANTCDAKFFSVLDANSGYWQIELDEDSSKLCTFNTPWGRYRFTRLPFGIKTAGDIFIEEMNKIFEGIRGVNVITDDILIYGETLEEHDKVLEDVLEKARKVNLKLNPKKSVICKRQVKYVGHVLSGEGIKPTDERIQAIVDMPTPTDKSAIQRFLGMIGYVGKFIPNLAQISKPLRLVLQKSVAFHWQEKQENAFKHLKQLLVRAPVLKFYDVKQSITIQVDACNSGLGAVLMQENRPVSMASKALNSTEMNYAIIEKELLAICFGCKKFHHYIYGKPVIVETDHKPLVSIMQKPIYMLSSRMQRMRMRLLNYNLHVVYIKGSCMYFADTLSRAHSSKTVPVNLFDNEVSVAELEVVNDFMQEIIQETKNDDTLQRLRSLAMNGWPNDKNEVPSDLKPFYVFKDEINISKSLVLKNDRIIIPKSMQKKMLYRLHESHLGLVKSKQLARDSIFWPGLNAQLEDMIGRCETCYTFRNNLQKESLISHTIEPKLFYKVGIDFFHVEGRNFLLLVDYYSKFPEVVEMASTTSLETIKQLKQMYARHGIPKMVVSDNGPQFKSEQYETFAKEYGFIPVYSSPMHPQSNGQVERCVQTVKRIIKKCIMDKQDVNIALLNYRNAKFHDLKASPAEMLMSRSLRSRVPQIDNKLKPRVVKNMVNKIKMRQLLQKKYFDRRGVTIHKSLEKGDMIRYRDHNNTWAKGIISKTNVPGPRNYEINNKANNVIKRNRKHIFRCNQRIENNRVAVNVHKEQHSPVRQQHDQCNEGTIVSKPLHKVIKTDSYITRYGRVSRPVVKYGSGNEQLC